MLLMVLPMSAVPFVALGLGKAKALKGNPAPIDVPVIVAPGLKADMVWPMALGLVCPSASA